MSAPPLRSRRMRVFERIVFFFWPGFSPPRQEKEKDERLPARTGRLKKGKEKLILPVEHVRFVSVACAGTERGEKWTRPRPAVRGRLRRGSNRSPSVIMPRPPEMASRRVGARGEGDLPDHSHLPAKGRKENEVYLIPLPCYLARAGLRDRP